MKLFKSFALGVVAMLALFMASAFGQSAPVRTTLSAAMTTIAAGQTSTISLTSETGMTASTVQAQTFLLIDTELMKINTFPTTTTATVSRGFGGTRVSAHLNGAEVIYGLTANFSGATGIVGGNTGAVFMGGAQHPVGSCVRNQQQTLPVINPSPGPDQGFYNCLGGFWVQQTMLDEGIGGPDPRICNIKQSGIALVSMGVDTIPGTAGNLYYSTFFNPTTKKVSNLWPLWGVTVGSATGFVAAIYEWNTVTSGALLFNTTTAGTASGTASTFQSIAVGTSGYLTGPASYMFALQGAGTTDGLRMLVGNAESFSTLRAGTFGTLPASVAAATGYVSTTAAVACYN